MSEKNKLLPGQGKVREFYYESVKNTSSKDIREI